MRRTVVGLWAVVALALAGLVAPTASFPAHATEPGSPGEPQPATVVYEEDFENRPAPTPILRLDEYASVNGVSYTADPAWLTNCNGWIASAEQPVDAAEQVTDCVVQNSWNRAQQLAQALGIYAEDDVPESNFATSAYTAGDPGPGLVEFETVENIPFTAGNGRFITFSVDVGATNCGVSAPQLQFQLLDDEGRATNVGAPVDACTGVETVAVPRLGVASPIIAGVGTATSAGSLLFAGDSVGVRMLNNNGSGVGNDHAFDNLQIVDATPQLDKSFTPTEVGVGQTSTLTFTVTNTDELAAKEGWSFTDILPAGLVLADDEASTTCSGGSIDAVAGADHVAVTGDLEAGEAACTVTVNVTADFIGSFTNGPDNINSTGLNPPAASTVTFTNEPGLELVKTADEAAQAEVEVGQEITYSFLATNTGNVTLTDVNINETEFSGSGDLSEPVCPPGARSLAPDAEVTCTATYTVTQADVDAGSVENTATAVGTPPAGEPPVESEPSVVTVPGVDPEPALELEKSSDLEEITEAGQEVTYSFLVTNSGNVTISDVVIDETEFSGTGDLSEIVCPPGADALAPGDDIICSATYTVTQGDVDAGTLDNIATATGDPPGDDAPPVESPPSEDTVTVVQEPGLDLVKSASPADEDSFAAGQEITYSFVVTNTGNVTVNDVAVDETEFSGTGDLSDVVCPPAVGSLAPSEQVTCTATYILTQDDIDAGSVRNAAIATGNPPGDGTPPIETPPSEVVLPTPPAPALDIVKSADVEEVHEAGQEVTYSFSVTNSGNVTMTDVTVVEGEFSGTGELSEVVCPDGTASMAPGEDVVCTATYTVTQADVDAGLIENTATASGTPPGDDDPISSASSTATVHVDPPASPQPSSPSPGPRLPSTGTDVVALLGLTSLLLVGGGVAVRHSRRSRVVDL